MKLERSVILDISILAVFTIYFLFRKNFEFLTYTFTISLLILIIALTIKKYNYSAMARYGFSAWLLMHLLGGAVYIRGTRLYDLLLIKLVESPLYILKYDQFVHAFCYFVITLFMLGIVKYYSNNKSKFAIGLITVLAATGIGAINEIIEFTTVIFFNAGAAVGDYYNNALDLVFNIIGAIMAVLLAKKK